MTFNFNILVKFIAAIIVGCGLLVILQMWFDLFSSLVFYKLLATLAILGLMAGLVIAVRQDLSDEKKLKDDKFVD